MARCAGCGRPLCLGCAVPVRGRVLGAECLAEALGGDAPPSEDLAPTRRGRPAQAICGAAFAVAALSTVLPWSRRNVGAGPFGAWGLSPRWSLVAAVAAVLGLAVWVAMRTAPPGRRPARALPILAAAVTGGALLAIWRPPAFTDTSPAPWLSLAAGLTALVASIAARRGHGRATGRERS